MHKIVFAPEARDDLEELYLFIAERADGDRAMAYVERIETWCRGSRTFRNGACAGTIYSPHRILKKSPVK